MKAQEQELKIKQKIQQLKNSYEKKFEEQEKIYTMIQKKLESVNLHEVISENEYNSLYMYLEDFCELGIGAEALLKILKEMDLTQVAEDLREALEMLKAKKLRKWQRD